MCSSDLMISACVSFRYLPYCTKFSATCRASSRVGSRIRLRGMRARAREPALEPVPGLSLPLRPHTGESPQTRWGERTALIGLGPHGRLNWRGTPVTRDMLEQQLSQVLAQDPQADVWLAADEALPYADLLPWLEWLQAQHVVRVTLLTRSLTPAQMSGKP